jgi:thiamine pyrophosphokinase
MSSHHIVRDEQEPALLLLEPDACSSEIIGQLLEWSPVVITTDQALDQVLDLQIKVDVVFYATNKKNELIEKLSDQYPVQLIEQPASGDFIANLLVYLRQRKQVALNIIAGTDAGNLLKEKLSHDFAVVLFAGQNKSYRVHSGKFEKWAAAGQRFYIKDIDQIVSTTNLEMKEVHPEKILQVQQDDFITIECSKSFWISEEVI